MRQAAYRTITTTLYDLISALQQQIQVADDHVIAVLVAYLLQSGQITFRRHPVPRTLPRGFKSAIRTGSDHR